jgi:hypothetical protein
MNSRLHSNPRMLLSLALFIFNCFALPLSVTAQNETTGAFQGQVSDATTGTPVSGARVQFTYSVNGIQNAKITDSNGRFYQGLLGPGGYHITISKQGYKDQELERVVFATQNNSIIPLPVKLEPESAAPLPIATPTVTPEANASPQPNPTPSAQSTPGASPPSEPGEIGVEINGTDGRRSGAFTEKEVRTLPLGGTTLVRTFDELAQLLPGVALPPQTQGAVSGPGVGSGVGSSGQFAVNGLRSRANNFTVDGSDNNDEDIGVRRQGFFSLVPQPIESIQEYQVTTLLAPAQYGRNIGAQVNAISKSGGNTTHGTIYGFFNASQLNARNFFDTVGGNNSIPLTSGNKPVLIDDSQGRVQLNNGNKDAFTLGQGGFVLGGPIVPNKVFYFFSVEGQLLNANKETHFAVPTIRQRGAFNSGDTGLAVDPLTGNPTIAFPTSVAGDAIFSLFPFPNNPGGPYGVNTFTQVLPASARSRIASAKIDTNFRAFERQHSFTARYNFTQDWRDIPAVGGALFAGLRPRVRTQNFSTFLNTELSSPNSTTPIFNQLRLSYGRTRLIFDERRDPGLLPTQRRFTNARDAQFLLNRPRLLNATLPGDSVVSYSTLGTTEDEIGPVGQVIIAGFSPVGVDVFNFPQRRVNNTYQFADTLTFSTSSHRFAFGTDNRRTELNSSLPRNARPLMTFNGAPRLIVSQDASGDFTFRVAGPGDIHPLITPQDFAAAGAPSGFFQTLVQNGSDSGIHLRYYQLNFFGQDEWRVRPNLSISYGLRYEYNTRPRELDQRIESTFSSPSLSLVPGLSKFIGGRSEIFDPDRNNFAPRVGFAYSPDLFGRDKATVIRAGYGLFYDQILGAVVSQSRNVFPTFSTINFGGGCNSGCTDFDLAFNIFNPIQTTYFAPGVGQVNIVLPGTLNTLNPAITLNNLVTTTNSFFGNLFDVAGNSAFGATLPSKKLAMPMAHHYSLTVEQQLNPSLIVSAAYVGTLGRHLLRFTSPNLGPNYLLAPLAFDVDAESSPTFFGVTLPPGTRITTAGDLLGGRPTSNVGAVNIFETTANSRYDALQLQARGRFRKGLQYQAAYTFSKVTDDVSDVFDLAGALALPQDSTNLKAERGPANFDARHRFSYNFIYDFPRLGNNYSRFSRAFFDGLQLAGTGMFQTGQPFTVNSIFDINLDGNLTDRLDNLNGITATGDRRQPLVVSQAVKDNPSLALATVGKNGSIGRNTFRAGNILELDMAVIKQFAFNERHRLTFRMDIFNFINRANFGIPVRFLEAPGFGQATDTVTPGRRIQFALKYSF